MERWPGRRSELNPLRLNKKLWLKSECSKFLRHEELSSTNDLTQICKNLFNEQRKIAKFTYTECNMMTRERFGYDTEEDMFNEENEDQSGSEPNIDMETDEVDLDLGGEVVEGNYAENEMEGEVTENESDGSDSESDFEVNDVESDDTDVKAVLALHEIGELVKNEDSLPTQVKQSRLYRREKKKYVLSLFGEKNSQEIVAELSQVPDSVCNLLLDEIMQNLQMLLILATCVRLKHLQIIT